MQQRREGRAGEIESERGGASIFRVESVRPKFSDPRPARN